MFKEILHYTWKAWDDVWKWNCINKRRDYDAESVILKLWWCSRRYFGLNISHVLLKTDSAQRSAIIECSQGFSSHAERLLLRRWQTLRHSAVTNKQHLCSLLPKGWKLLSVLFRQDLDAQVWNFWGSKLLTFHVYLISLGFFFSSWKGRNISLTAPHHCFFSFSSFSLPLYFIYLSVLSWALLIPGP